MRGCHNISTTSVYLHALDDGTGVTNLSNNTIIDGGYQISGSNVVWAGEANGDWDIYVHNGTETLAF